jgi:hypothetical protein
MNYLGLQLREVRSQSDRLQAIGRPRGSENARNNNHDRKLERKPAKDRPNPAAQNYQLLTMKGSNFSLRSASMLTSSTGKRIRPAPAAFGALKNILTNKDIDLKVKGSVDVALCSSTLLYGSGVWCLRGDLFNRLRHFHQQCARTMCRITIAHTIRHRILSASLFKRFQLSPSTRRIL